MSIKNQRFLSISMFIISWITISFLGKKDIKKYFFSSFLIVLFEAINAWFGKKRKWWVFYNKPNSYFFGEFPFEFGPFLAISLWVLKWSNGNFKKFLLLNALVDGFFAFVCIKVLELLKIARLVRINEVQFFFYFFYKSFLLYGIQYFIGKKQAI